MINFSSQYSIPEIKEMFKDNNWELDPEEYEILWETLSLLKKEHVDTIQKEICLIVFGQQKTRIYSNKSRKGLYINLKDTEFLRNCKGVIILSPFFFGDENDDNWRDNGAYTILHELAHHRLNHSSLNDDDKVVNKTEEAAIDLALNWAYELNLKFLA